MKNSIEFSLFFCVFFTLALFGQEPQKYSIDSLSTTLEHLPKISTDSTATEITTHVEAMREWMLKESYKHNYANVLIHAERGLALAKRSNNKDHIHNLRTIIGNTLLRVKDTLNAKQLFLKTLEEARRANDSTHIVWANINLSNIYFYTKGQKQKTIELYLESLQIAEKLNDIDNLFVLHHNLAISYDDLKNLEQTTYHISKSAYYLNLLGDPPYYKARHLHNMGRKELLQNDPDAAITYFKQAIKLSVAIQFNDALIDIYKSYKEALVLKKDYKKLYEIDEKLKTYKVEKENEEAESTIASISAKFEVERYKEQLRTKELEKALLKQKASSKSYLLLFNVIIIVALVIYLITMYIAIKKRNAYITDLKHKNMQYLAAKQKSDELTKAKTKFFAAVNHELRTPLYGVIGLSAILLENNELEKHEKDLKSLNFSANYLLTLINNLLHINKIENNSFSNEITTFDLEDLTGAILTSFEYIRLQHHNTIRVTICKDIPLLLEGDSVGLSQILMNLVGNACKFTENGTIDLDIKLVDYLGDKVKLRFVIKDTGPGIAAHKLSQIFDEFTQVSSATSAYQGTGLGLPIVKKLIEQANGSITVDSKLGSGTAFTFELDFTIANTSNNQKEIPLLKFNILAKKQILIVEDNRINQTITKRILESENVVCTIAQNGEEAVTLVKQSYFDLVLMDINMPVKNGIDATIEIRKFNESIPIVALTAVEIEEQKRQILDCGMNDIILKPYDVDLFKHTIIANFVENRTNLVKKRA